MLACDIQGVGRLITDPAVHTKDPTKLKATCNCGFLGMAKFFEGHRCNHICRALGLTDHSPRKGRPGDYGSLSHASTRSAWTKGAPSSRGPSKRRGDELRRARAAAAVGSGGGGGASRGTAPAARHDPGLPISVILATASRVPGHALPSMDEEYGPPRWGVSTTDYESAIPSYAKALGLELAPPD